jgi:uncharacterized protein (TIRG00374 family)
VAETDLDTFEDIAPPPPAPPPSRLRVILGWVFKIIFVGGIFGLLFGTGKITVADMRMQLHRWDLALLAMSMAIPALLVCSLRYKLLLKVLNISAHFGDIVALSMIGMLFDLVSPVSNGGDLVKAVYLSKATRSPTGKSNFGIILFSVVLDRIMGLFALFTFALIACLFAWPQISGSPQLRKLSYIVVIVCAGGLLGFFVLVSEALEKSALRKRLMHVIPFHGRIERIYSGFASLRHHKFILFVMLGLSIINHACSCAAILILAQGIAFTSASTNAPAALEWIPCLTVLPLGMFATTFGPAGGLGGGNLAFEYLFHTVLNLNGGGKLVLAFQICGILVRLTGIPVLMFYKHNGANLTPAPSVSA